MKNIFYLVLITMISCSADTTFKISGNISNLNGDLIYAKIVNESPVTLDTINIVDGMFNFNAQNLSEHDFRFLIPVSNQKKFIKIFIDNSDIQIKGNLDSLNNIIISGSKSHTLFENLMKEYEQINIETQLLVLEVQMAKNDEDGVSVTNLQEKLYANEDKKPKLFIDFAKSHPNTNVSAWALLQIISFAEYNELATVYDLFSDKVKSSTYSKTLKHILDDLGKTAIGAEAPKFSLPNADGKNINLDDFKGKVVLIDFWSPMCVYCRLENPHMVELYKKYKNKGFEIIGINVEGNEDLDVWQMVIEEDKLPWAQLLDKIGVADIYKVKNTPYNVLIDAEGIIIAKDLHQDGLDKKLKELFE